MNLAERFKRNLMSGNFTRNILLFFPHLLTKAIKKLDLYIQTAARRTFGRSIPIQNNKILFINFQGSYTCNQKAIANEIIRQKLPYELVFVVIQENEKKIPVMSEFPACIKTVRRGSYEFYQEAASAKIWIDNSINMEYLNARKKKEQIIIETWHGSIGLKKMTKDAMQDKKWLRKAIKYGKKTDYCISNSTWETKNVYLEQYWYRSKILEYGHPRNDILINSNSEEAIAIKKKVKNYFHIPDHKKILLYAPTFRESKTLDYYNIDYNALKNVLEQKFGGEWVILVKLHFKCRKLIYITKFDENVINATKYVDMQELILTCNMGITDYSSWICDLALTTNPGFLYVPDIEAYTFERGLFFPLSDTPFPIAYNNEQLLKNIIDFQSEVYERKRKKFLKSKGCIEDGKASQRVVQKIQELINQSNGGEDE